MKVFRQLIEARCIYHDGELPLMIEGNRRLEQDVMDIKAGSYTGSACEEPGCHGFYAKEFGYRYWPQNGAPKHKSPTHADISPVHAYEAFCEGHNYRRYAVQTPGNRITFLCPIDECRPVRAR